MIVFNIISLLYINWKLLMKYNHLLEVAVEELKQSNGTEIYSDCSRGPYGSTGGSFFTDFHYANYGKPSRIILMRNNWITRYVRDLRNQ